jgi:hypothetical protein
VCEENENMGRFIEFYSGTIGAQFTGKRVKVAGIAHPGLWGIIYEVKKLHMVFGWFSPGFWG